MNTSPPPPRPAAPKLSIYCQLTANMPPVRRVYLLAKLGELEPAILETTFWELAMRGRKELAEGRLEGMQHLHGPG